MRRILLACPTIRGPGGIATYARRVMEAVAPEPVAVLNQGLEDPRFELPANARLIGTARSQASFAARLATELISGPPTLFVFAHVGLTAPLGLLPRVPRHRVVALLHGIEAWGPLRRQRALGLPRVDDLVFTTRYTREMFVYWNGAHLRQESTRSVIPLCAESILEAQPPRPLPLAKRHRVLCVTRLPGDRNLKGIPTLLHAARGLDPERWEIVVAGDGGGRAALEKETDALGVSDRVRFLGWVSDEERSRLFVESDIFCLPSGQEGFGIVFLEAMAAGRPCVGAAAGAVPEVVPHEAGELFPYGDPEALAAALRRVSERLASRDLTPASIRGVYDRRYAWNRFASAWREHLGQLRA